MWWPSCFAARIVRRRSDNGLAAPRDWSRSPPPSYTLNIVQRCQSGDRVGADGRGRGERLVSLLAGSPRHGSPRGGSSGLGGPTITMKKIPILLALTATALTLAAC